MSTDTHAAAAHGHAHPKGHASGHVHTVPVWGLFLALLVLTALEVALFEVWHREGPLHHFVPKLTMVLMLLACTLPKAVIVMVYFMHLKFEKQMIVMLALVPLVLVFVAVVPILTDILTLRPQSSTKVEGLGSWVPPYHHGHGAKEGSGAHGAVPGAATESAHDQEPASASHTEEAASTSAPAALDAVDVKSTGEPADTHAAPADESEDDNVKIPASQPAASGD